MSWRRLPTFFPNFPLRLLPLSEAQKTALLATGHVEEAVFRTVPSIGKVEIKQFLERVYGLSVASVNTANAEGKKKKGKTGKLYRKPDYKKAYVRFNPPGGATAADKQQ